MSVPKPLDSRQASSVPDRREARLQGRALGQLASGSACLARIAGEPHLNRANRAARYT